MTLSTTVTFDDLIQSHRDELDDLRDAYDDAVAMIEDEFGADALDQPLHDEPDDDELQRLAGLRVTAVAYEESGKQIQRRINALETLREEYDPGAFEIKMLSGEALMDIETQLKLEAKRHDTDADEIQHVRKQLVVDAATVSAPGGVPTGDDGSPTPSDAPNPLTFALYEQVERLNNAGATDFRAPGFGDQDVSLASAPASESEISESPADSEN